MACESFAELVVGSLYFSEVVPKIFTNLNVVGHLAIPAVWGSYLPRLAIFCISVYTSSLSTRLDHLIT